MVKIGFVMRKQLGQSIVQVLIACALMGIVALAFATMMINQQRETTALGEKLASLSLKNLLVSGLADGSVCLYSLNHPSVLTFDSTSAATVAFAAISVNKLFSASGNVFAQASPPTIASPDSKTLVVNQIQLTNFSGSGTSYTANWVISFDSSKSVRALKPITIPANITVDNSTPAATKITGCNAGIGGLYNGCNGSTVLVGSTHTCFDCTSIGGTPFFIPLGNPDPGKGGWICRLTGDCHAGWTRYGLDSGMCGGYGVVGTWGTSWNFTTGQFWGFSECGLVPVSEVTGTVVIETGCH